MMHTLGDYCKSLRVWFLPSPFLPELSALIKLSIPIISLTVLQYTINMTSVIFCGRLGKLELDAVSLASSIHNALAMTTSLGLVEGYETLFTQAFGSKNKKLMGLYLQRSLILQLLAFLVSLAILINAEGICIGLGQDREISFLAGQYMLRYCPGVFGIFFFTLIARYLQDMNQVLPTVVIVLCGNAVNITAHFVFIYTLKLGTNGSAYAVSLANLTMLAMALLFITWSKEFKKTWPGWSRAMWLGWGKLLKLGMAAYGTICFEWWAFEVAVFLTGVLGTTELGAQSLSMNVDAVTYNILTGIGITGTIRVGQHLGAGDASAAKTACFTAFIYNFFPTVVLVSLIASLRQFLPQIFTNVEDIINLVSQILPLIAAYTFATSMTTWATGVFRGSGRQHIGAACFFVGFYVVGLPVAVYLMFYTSLRSLGFWVSVVCILSASAVVMVILVLRTDWDEQVKQAAKNTSVHAVRTNQVDDERTALLRGVKGHQNTTNKQLSFDTEKRRNANSDHDSKNSVNKNDMSSDCLHGQEWGGYLIKKYAEKATSRNDINEDVTIKEETNDMKWLAFTRIVTLFFVLLILLSGVIVRLTVQLPQRSDNAFLLQSYNETTTGPWHQTDVISS